MSVSNQEFILDGGRLLSYCGQEEEVVVPAGVIRVESGAFSDRENLRRARGPAGRAARRSAWWRRGKHGL